MKGVPAVFGVRGGEEIVGRIIVRVGVIHERVARVGKVDSSKNLQCIGHVLVLQTQQPAIFLVGKRISIRRVNETVRFGISRRVVRNPQQIVTSRVGKIGHGRGGTPQRQRQRRGDRHTGERRSVGQAGFDHGAVEDPVFDQIIVRCAGLPIILGIEVRARLFRIRDAMHERQVACVVNRREEFQ